MSKIHRCHQNKFNIPRPQKEAISEHDTQQFCTPENPANLWNQEKRVANNFIVYIKNTRCAF